MSVAVLQGDCLEVMPELADGSIDLIVTDSPYYKVKSRLAWDNQWKPAEEYLDLLGKVLDEFKRLLALNGSLYVFASPRMAARVECAVGERFQALNRITWRKHDGSHNEGGLWSRASKDALRRFFEQKEEIIFAEHFGADTHALGGWTAKCDELRGFVFEPLRAYLDGERRRAGINYEQVRQAVGCRPGSGLPGHWFTKSQWMLPTAAHYAALQLLFNVKSNGEPKYLLREYEGLRREYEGLRRPFTVSADVPYTDVWNFKTVPHKRGKHPCEKPEALIEHILKASGKPGLTVLDGFAGSGVVGKVARRLNMDAILIEQDAKWVKNIKAALAQNGLFAMEK